MRPSHRTSIALAAVALPHHRLGRATPAGPPCPASAARPSPASSWLARTPDGVLHAIWNRGATPTSIFDDPPLGGRKAIGTSIVATGFDGNGGLGLLAMPDRTLRLFAAGATHPGSSAYGITNFTAPAGGGTWSLQGGAYWGGAVASSSGVIGATLTKDGQPVTAWRGFAAEGSAPTVPQSAYEPGMTASQVATDAATGAVVLSGVTNAALVSTCSRCSRAARVVLPLPSGENDWYASRSGRIGAGALCRLPTPRLCGSIATAVSNTRGGRSLPQVSARPDGRL